MSGIGVAGWIYFQMMRRTGSNTKSSVIAAALAGLVAAFVIYSFFAWAFPAEPSLPTEL